VLNGSEVRAREKKDSEIRYVRMVMSKLNDKSGEIELLHPRFYELKKLHGIEDERASAENSGPKNIASGLISITLKCVGPSMGEKPHLTKKLPGSITVVTTFFFCIENPKSKTRKICTVLLKVFDWCL
jgi:hypothetical protein